MAGAGDHHRWRVGTVTIAADVPGVPAEGIEVFGATGAVRVDLHFPFSRRPATVRAYRDGAGWCRPSPTATPTSARSRRSPGPSAKVAPRYPDVRDGLAAVRLIEATATAVERGSEVRL